jgi:inosose dehydratase
MRLATGPVTWGVDFADTPTNPPWELVLDEIAQSGIGALELGPVGYLPEEPATLRAALRERHLVAVGSFIFDNLHVPGEAQRVIEAAERACRAIAAAEGSVLVIIDRPGPERAATAGRSDAARRLDAHEWARMLETTNEIAAIAVDYGLRPAFHPHAGGFVEFEDEIARLVNDTDLPLCLDTGHCAYAGVAPEQALTMYASRLAHVHLKDVRGKVLSRVRDEGLGFWEAIAAGVFCPLGEGVVDLAGCQAVLHDILYDGFATIEQDREPGRGSPLDDLLESVRVMGGLPGGNGPQR